MKSMEEEKKKVACKALKPIWSRYWIKLEINWSAVKIMWITKNHVELKLRSNKRALVKLVNLYRYQK